MLYGIKLEPAAREWYKYHYRHHVHTVSFVTNQEQPWLGCSPDGLIQADGVTELLEIKCAYSKRSGKEKFIEGKCLPYLVVSNGACKLRESHQYYTQIQLSLYVLGLQVCRLLIYTPKEQMVLTIPRCDTFLSHAVSKLERFYFTHLLPKLALKSH